MAKTNTNVEAVLAELRDGIRHGRYAPGQRLVTSDLSRELSVSLSPVREALHILTGEGIVEIEPNRGARIRTPTPQSFIDGLEVLEVIGVLAFKLLTRKLHGAALPNVKELRAAIADAGRRRDPHAFFAAIAASHRAANDAAGNSYLNPILERLHLEYFYRQMADCLPGDFWEPYIDNYDRMGALLQRGDVRGAEQVWKGHIKWLVGLIQRTMEKRSRRS